MDKDQGFSPLIGVKPRVLVLGTMPSQQSLKRQQYYGHPQNAFWWIIDRLFGIAQSAPYETRVQALIEHKVAVWDVVREAVRPGSLDANIDQQSLVANPFAALFSQQCALACIVFNGQAAQKLFKKYVLSETALPKNLDIHTLPSTSPAYAAMTREEKLARWKVIKDYL